MKIGIVCIACIFPSVACAASLVFVPGLITAEAGQSFTLEVVANPASSTIDSIRAAIAFNPAVLTEESFVLAPSWVGLSEPGYDAVDTTQGLVLKTAGYPGGITRSTPLGTLTFKVRRNARAAVVITGNTEMLDGGNVNQFTAAGAALVTSKVGVSPVLHTIISVPQPARRGASPTLTPLPRQSLWSGLVAIVKRLIYSGN